MLAIGTKAPAFSLPDQNENIHTLEQYKGKKSFFIFTQKTTHRDAANLIDENGIIIKASDKVKAADNPQQMLDFLLEI